MERVCMCCVWMEAGVDVSKWARVCGGIRPHAQHLPEQKARSTSSRSSPVMPAWWYATPAGSTSLRASSGLAHTRASSPSS